MLRVERRGKGEKEKRDNSARFGYAKPNSATSAPFYDPFLQRIHFYRLAQSLANSLQATFLIAF